MCQLYFHKAEKNSIAWHVMEIPSMSGTVLSIFHSYSLSHIRLMATYDILTLSVLQEVILNMKFANHAQCSSKHTYNTIYPKPAILDVLGFEVR